MCYIKEQLLNSRRAKLGQIQGGCRGPAKIRQRGGGGVAIFFYFLRVKNRFFFRFYAKRLKKAYFLKEFYAIKRSFFRISS